MAWKKRRWQIKLVNAYRPKGNAICLRTWQWRVLRGERCHTEIKASRRGRENFRFWQKIRGGCVLGLDLVLVTAGRGRWSIRRRCSRVGRVLVVTTVTAVTTGQLQWFTLDVVFEGAVLLVHAVTLDLARQMVVLHHREIRGRRVVVVERRRRHPRLLRRFIVRIRRSSLVPAYLCSA